MIQNIIVKVRKGQSLADDEMSYLESVIKQPQHPDWTELYLNGLV